MNLRKIVSKLRQRLNENPVSDNKFDGNNLVERIKYLEEVVSYLGYENSRLSSILRYISAPVISELPATSQTRQSFDFQWDKIPEGRFMLSSEEFRKEATGYVCEFTWLDPKWFKGKNVIDVGCGQGRYSWALCKLGANVLSVDQSQHGLEITRGACKEFPNHRVLQVDLLKPLQMEEKFDLVWCYGVLHHTGDTYGAFKNVIKLVKPVGYIFLMLYGEPRDGITGDYSAVNEYFYWRKITANMTFNDKLDAIKKGMEENKLTIKGGEHIHGYFDAISPTINDLYSWKEIEGWLLEEGFQDIKRTVDTRNHHLIAKKS